MLNSLSVYAPQARAVLRIVTALLFIQHGTQKLFDFPAWPAEAMGPVSGLLLVAGILELVGGLAVLVGIFTRPVAFILSGMMAVAYFMAHAPMGFFPALNMGDAAVLFCFVFLYLAFAGPGAWALDNRAAA